MKMKKKNKQITICLVAILAFLIGLGFFLPKTVFSARAEETSPETVTVTLVDGYSNTIIGTKKVVVGEEFHFFTMTRPNYTFNGWMYNGELLTRADGVGIDVWKITQDVTLEPDWIPYRKMIEFDTGYEMLTVTAMTIDYMTRTTLYSSEVMQRTGYIFAGWYDGEGGTGTQYATEDGNMVRDWDKGENPTTLYAKWDVITYSIKFYAGDNDILVRELSYTIETEDIILEDYEEVGKRFMGWFDNKSYETSSKISKIPKGSSGDKNLYAWQKQLCDVSAPEITYSDKVEDGTIHVELGLTQRQLKALIAASATDNKDGKVSVTYIFPECMFDANGKLIEGEFQITITAVDSSNNKTSVIVRVCATDTQDTESSDTATDSEDTQDTESNDTATDSGNLPSTNNGKGEKAGCGSVTATGCGLALLFAASMIVLKKKKDY